MSGSLLAVRADCIHDGWVALQPGVVVMHETEGWGWWDHGVVHGLPEAIAVVDSLLGARRDATRLHCVGFVGVAEILALWDPFSQWPDEEGAFIGVGPRTCCLFRPDAEPEFFKLPGATCGGAALRVTTTFTSEQWARITGDRPDDPDGWDRSHLAESWREPITWAEWHRRLSASTLLRPLRFVQHTPVIPRVGRSILGDLFEVEVTS